MQKWCRSNVLAKSAARQMRWVYRWMHLMHRLIMLSKILWISNLVVKVVREWLSVTTWLMDDAQLSNVDQVEGGKLRASPHSIISVLNVDVSSPTVSCLSRIWWHTVVSVRLRVESRAATNVSDRARHATTMSGSTPTPVPMSVVNVASASSWRRFSEYTWSACTVVASLSTAAISAVGSSSWSADSGRTFGLYTPRIGRTHAPSARSGSKAASSWCGTRGTCTAPRSHCTARCAIAPSRRRATCGLTWGPTRENARTSVTSVASGSLIRVRWRVIGWPITKLPPYTALQRPNATQWWMCLIGWHSVLLSARFKVLTGKLRI